MGGTAPLGAGLAVEAAGDPTAAVVVVTATSSAPLPEPLGFCWLQPNPRAGTSATKTSVRPAARLLIDP